MFSTCASCSCQQEICLGAHLLSSVPFRTTLEGCKCTAGSKGALRFLVPSSPAAPAALAPSESSLGRPTTVTFSLYCPPELLKLAGRDMANGVSVRHRSWVVMQPLKNNCNSCYSCEFRRICTSKLPRMRKCLHCRTIARTVHIGRTCCMLRRSSCIEYELEMHGHGAVITHSGPHHRAMSRLIITLDPNDHEVQKRTQ